MSFKTILYQQDEGVLTITLNRPTKLNAGTDEMLGELIKAFKQAGRDSSVRCVILTGAGRGFCAGQDLGSTQERESDMKYGAHLRHTWNPLVARMRDLQKPIICAVNGVAAGAGMSLVLASDLRYASDKASFIQAFVKIGLVPDSGSTWSLQRLVGPTRAMDMMITGRKVRAEEALEWGLVNAVVEHDNLMSDVQSLANTLAAMPTRTIGLIKRTADYAANHSFADTLEYEADLQDIAGSTADHKEGVMAFLEKRTPVFTGK